MNKKRYILCSGFEEKNTTWEALRNMRRMLSENVNIAQSMVGKGNAAKLVPYLTSGLKPSWTLKPQQAHRTILSPSLFPNASNKPIIISTG